MRFLRLADIPEEFVDAASLVSVRECFMAPCEPLGIPVSLVFDEAMQGNACSVATTRARPDGPAESYRITSGGIAGAMRALGRMIGDAIADRETEPFDEAPCLDMLCVMMDASRNAVPSVEYVAEYMMKCAMMGVNAFMLYTEDTYEVPGEPYMGYLRGRYSHEDLRRMDDYAAAMGIEMIPCIQTLGHMEQFLQWASVSGKYGDTDRVLCAFDDKVYGFIERCIVSISSCFRTKKIHLGMDEAWGLGTGNFKRKYGDVPTAEIMNRHLARVNEICRKHGLKPAIWSDMYFRLGSKTHDYYDEDWSLSEDVIREIPKDVVLGYWDYYHRDPAHYEKFIGLHRRLGSEPLMVGGIWTWSQIWCNLNYSIDAMTAMMRAVRKTGLRRVVLTMWGDDGCECDFDTALPGIQHVAEIAYSRSGEIDAELRDSNLMGSCRMRFADAMLAASLNENRAFMGDKLAMEPCSVARTLLWEDPALGIEEYKATRAEGLADFYADAGEKLCDIAEGIQDSAGNEDDGIDDAWVFSYAALVAKILGKKIGLRDEIRGKLLSVDREAASDWIMEFGCPRILDLAEDYEELRDMWQYRWMKTRSPFGWEVVESRLATVISRCNTLSGRLIDWAKGKIEHVPEFEEELLDSWLGKCVSYARMKTPSFIK